MRTIKPLFLCVLAVLLCSIQAWAQTRTLRGRVTDAVNGLPLANVTIALEGNGGGVATDSAGRFTLHAPAGAKLVVTHVGYATLKITPDDSNTLDILLQPANAADLGDVVVVGYGARKKATLTGSIVQVGEEVFKDRPLANAATALQGFIPGLQITRTSTRPGNEGLSIVMRGASSVSAVDPLIIIDGVPLIGTWEFNQINPNDIESVTALKDASAAIYGARAQGGVVLVTTKRGKGGKMQVSLNSNFNRNTIGITVPWASMSQWASLYLQTSTSDKRDVAGNPVEWFPQWTKDNLIKMAADSSFDYTDPSGIVHHYANNNWQDALYGPSWSNQQNLSVRGSNGKTAYMFSLGYSDNKSLLKTAYDGEKKYTTRFNYDYNISDRVRLETSVSFDNRTVQSPRNGVGNGYFDAPIFPVYNKLGQYYDDYGFRNPVAFTQSGGTTKNREGIVRLNAKLIAEVLKGLKLTGNAAVVKRDGWNTAYNQTFNLYNWLGTKVNSIQYGPPNNPAITETIGNTVYQTYSAQADYIKTIAKHHNIAVMAGTSAELSETKALSASRSQLQYDGLYDINTAISPTTASFTGLNSGGSSHWGLVSYFTRINYDYKRKYLLEVLGRRDGSSRFDISSRWSNFYGISGGWRITEEPFMKHINWLDELKIKGGYGETGGQASLGNYDYLALIGTGTALFGSTPALQTTGYLNGITTNQRTWERMAKKNIALEFGMLTNRLTGTFEMFENKNTGMLIRVVYPSILGGQAPTTNSGTLRTRGWELTLNWKDKIGAVQYNVGFNLFNAKNTVLSYAGANTWAEGKYTTPREGYPLNSIYVYKTDGYFQTQQQANDYFTKYGASGRVATYNGGAGATNVLRPGDLKVVDLDGDGKITPTGTGLKGSGDLYYYGDADPHYQFGINLGAQWRGFDFGAFIQGVYKWNILRTGNGRAPFFRNYLNVNTTYIGKTWTPDNPGAQYPRLSFDNNVNNWNWQFNDVNVQNLRYARLKMLVIGYTLPRSVANRIKADKLRVYFSGNDLFELTSVRDGFDPERGESSDNSYPFFRTWAFGLNLTF
ncbi:TonB-linked outer membrane protein, SusC/RagA family [Filimonas lacunae]|uniref:TonB-linked outer membrane protein, SusC/RagA family n=1 Tax=Filimonas lacunae TaxID=477680 RepID=A0A173MHV2_9BACT|nr:SusC/RagA family TonB-linked outer membrane protein [Filimonas lacunae]BAV07001.1 TonB-dependent receptor [Filimonas lacunae]SIS96597.1 TonB-linked outer membrane protein, SusC/RagA family [Filimonas lacunae]